MHDISIQVLQKYDTTHTKQINTTTTATATDQLISDKLMISIQVLFFASAREAAGDISKKCIELTPDEANTSSLRRLLALEYPGLASMVRDEENLTLALNEEYVTRGQVLALKDGDTIALIPPISGG